MKKIKLTLAALSLFFYQAAFSYKLPYEGINKKDAFEFVSQSDGTYKIYSQVPDMPRTYLYHTQPGDLGSVYFEFCGNEQVAEGDFFYRDEQKFPTETIFFNPKTREVSPVYPYQDWLCAESMPLMMSWAPLYHLDTLIVLQPIFKSEPPVWLVIRRILGAEFPGSAGIESKFLKSGKFYLVTLEDDEEEPFRAKVGEAETIPIPYSIFRKLVSKPTCYIMPEDHKLRLCNVEEAKLRTPALKAFLGET